MTFDPENARDPLRHGFHCLRSLTEEQLGPGAALHPHPPESLVLLTYVREGALTHQPAGEAPGRQGPGEIRRTSVARGAAHPSANASRADPAHVIQGCLSLADGAVHDRWEQRRFPIADREGILRLVASLEGAQASLRMPQDVRIYSSVLLLGHHLIHELGSGRGAWLQVVRGTVLLRDQELRAGDGAALEDEAALSLTARDSAEIMLFDLA